MSVGAAVACCALAAACTSEPRRPALPHRARPQRRPPNLKSSARCVSTMRLAEIGVSREHWQSRDRLYTS